MGLTKKYTPAVVFDNFFQTIFWEKETLIMHLVWKETTKEMTEAQFREEVLQQVDLVFMFQAKYWLSDCRKFFFLINPEHHNWTNKTYLQMGRYVRKSAVVQPEEFFAQLAVDLAIHESNYEDVIVIFRTEEEAREWLMRDIAQSLKVQFKV